MNNYLPQILLAGDPNKLDAKDPINIQIVGTLDYQQFGNKIELRIKEDADYILISDDEIYRTLRKPLHGIFGFGKVICREAFERCITNVGFVNCWILEAVKYILKDIFTQKKHSKHFSALDVDSFFLRAELMLNPFAQSNFFNEENFISRDEISIDLTAPTQKLEAIHENLYDHVYNSLEDIRFKSYDVTILSAERSFDEWKDILSKSIGNSKFILIFIQARTGLINPLLNFLEQFGTIYRLEVGMDSWIICEKSSSTDLKIGIAVHKKYRLPELPNCYQPIHAGKKNSQIDLGIVGDDSGTNISELNPWLNELTVIYWIWKNDRHDFIGLAHYHRFFASPQSKVDNFFPLNQTEALEILKDFDIILGEPATFFGTINNQPDDNQQAYDAAMEIFERHLKIHQSDYVETFNSMKSMRHMFPRSMFITRWQIFDEYCEWLYSFLIPAAKEFSKLGFEGRQSRSMGLLGERCLTLFAMHNRLRIKLLPIGEGEYESDSTNISNFAPMNFVVD